jgi:hypothetical protein
VRHPLGKLPEAHDNRAFFEGNLMHKVLILGAGKIGALISGLLAESGSYHVQLGDVDGAAAESVVRAWTPFPDRRAHGADRLPDR